MSIGDFFGTLQNSITFEWRKHLQSHSNDEHLILNDYYEDMPELVDALIEAYQADHEIVKDYNNLLSDTSLSPVQFLEKLKQIVLDGYELMDSPELESLCDNIMVLIDSTLYKLKNLVKEDFDSMMNIDQFLKEELEHD